jgi:heat shock protein 1/8
VEAAVAKAKADEAAGGLSGASLAERSVIGIDLGTTYSCVAVWRNGEAEVLMNSEGERTTPSWVSFDAEGNRLVGDPAMRSAAGNPKNTLFNIKRIIGRQFSECDEEIKRFPFTVLEGAGGKPVIKVEVAAGEEREFLPEQISAMVLEKMKTTAEAALGCAITKAVVTVPAYFNDAQRRLTKDAGTIAGLDVLRIINEPTAAALAYGLDKKNTKGDAAKPSSQTILVFDLGGGTFDVSLLKIEDGVFEVLATSGDTHLGGEDFDSILSDWVIAEERRKRGEDIFGDNAKSLRRLRTACERAKRQLSSSLSATIELSVGETELAIELTRARFDKLLETTFQRCMESVKRCLTDAKLPKEAVDEIVLVGGSTRVPRVQQILSEFFGGKALNKSVHPDEAVAYGAAVQGAILAGVRDSATSNVLLVDVIPLSLGVECEGRQFAKVVPRNTAVPCKKASEFTTVEDWQTEIDVRIFEGERGHTDGNHLLGEFQITGVQRARRGEAKVLVTFEVNTNGLLNVSARDKVTGASADVSIEHDAGRLSTDEIQKMVDEAAKFKAQDEARARAFAERAAAELGY